MAYDLKDESEVKEYIQNLHTEFQFQCHGEKRPDGCHRLGDFYEATQQNFKEAAKVFKMNCDTHSFGHSCFKYGNYNMLGKGLDKKDELEAFKYYKSSCDKGFIPGCHNYALLLGSGKGTGQKEWKQAESLLQRCCSQDYVDSCYYLSGMYIKGRDSVSKDFKKAFEVSKKACGLGSVPACTNLSIMYKRGEGVDKNLKLSKQFQEKAIKMHEETTNPEKQIKFGE